MCMLSGVDAMAVQCMPTCMCLMITGVMHAEISTVVTAWRITKDDCKSNGGACTHLFTIGLTAASSSVSLPPQSAADRSLLPM